MDENALDIFSTARARRDVARIREALAEVKAGDVARVIVRSPRYGLYALEGTVRIGVGGQPLVGDVILATSSEIQRIDLGIEPPQPALEAYPVSKRIRSRDVDDYTLLEPAPPDDADAVDDDADPDADIDDD